ncbi:anti-sigma factor family protein [Piscinibacter sakaiensis]|uniref:anti-sigma factor family protein n=1 Tax=Piscinibacter sakaiensis TaxID=1547922 RepID=UPI003AADD1F3
MMEDDRISDQQLSAWVDGELDGPDRERVDAWLQRHPDDAERVKQWAADRAAIAALGARLAGRPVPRRLRAAVWRGDGTQRRWLAAAAAAGLLLVGAAAGGGFVWQWQQVEQQARLAELREALAAGSADGWAQRAALAHSVYVAEPRHAVEVKAQEEHLARWLTRRIDVPVKLFDLREQGFELVGGRLLPDGPGKSAQLMYQDGQQRRVTVYLRKPEQGTDAAFRHEQHGDVGMFYWVEDGAGYALVGELPRESLLALSEAIYRQIQ